MTDKLLTAEEFAKELYLEDCKRLFGNLNGRAWPPYQELADGYRNAARNLQTKLKVERKLPRFEWKQLYDYDRAAHFAISQHPGYWWAYVQDNHNQGLIVAYFAATSVHAANAKAMHHAELLNKEQETQ